jgi:hypothetical protein
MWGHLIKLLSLGKGALVIGVAASAAMVSNAEITNTPSHQNNEPSPSAIVSAPPTTTRPANSPSPLASPKHSEVPAVQLPASSSPASPSTASGLVKECLAKLEALRAAGDSASNGERESAAAVCKVAVEQSGLTTKELAAKLGLTTSPTSSPKTEHNTASLEAAIHQCLKDWRNYAETSSAACAQALAASGLSTEDFWKKFEAWAVEQPYDTDTTTDVDALVKECFAKYTAKDPTTLETCKKAMAVSGLSGDAFWDKYGRPTPPSSTPKPSTSPKSSWSQETYQLVALCFRLHSAITSTSEKATIDAAYDACNKAIAATGMSATEFWTKFAKELASTKPSATPSPKPVTNPAEVEQLIAKCLDLYKQMTTTGDTKSVSDACKAAIIASGMSSADFWNKYHPTTSPAPTASPKPVTNSAEVAQLIARCVDLYKNLKTTGDTKTVSDACKAAIIASGMSSSDFWAKYNPYVN